MKHTLFLKFTASMSLYYMSNAVIIGFAALFMQSRGFSNTEIGVLFSVSALCCIVLQYFTGPFLDSHPSVSAKVLALASGFLSLSAGILLCMAPQKGIIFLCYTVTDSLMLADASLYNSLGMEYINAGVSLNYSLSRGFASFFYAAAALIMGGIVDRFSVASIFPVYFILQCASIGFLLALRPAGQADRLSFTHTENGHKKPTEGSDSFFAFFRRNPRILFLLVSILLLYISYTSINNFHINIIEEAGGGSRELGISVSFAAILELPAMALFLPLARRSSYRSLLCVSCAFFFIKAAALSCAGSITGVYLSQCLQFFSYGLFIPASAYFMNSVLPVQDKTKGQAALGIFTFGLSGLIASPLSGIILDRFGVRRMLIFVSVLALIGLAGVCAACFARLKPDIRERLSGH